MKGIVFQLCFAVLIASGLAAIGCGNAAIGGGQNSSPPSAVLDVPANAAGETATQPAPDTGAQTEKPVVPQVTSVTKSNTPVQPEPPLPGTTTFDWPADTPAQAGPRANDQGTGRKTPDEYIVSTVDPTIPTTHHRSVNNDPDFSTYQSWQEAKSLARTDLDGAIAKVEETIRDTPDLTGDAYFTMAQCMEYSMEIPLFVNRDNPQLSRVEAEKRFNKALDYYQKAIDAYGQPGAKTLLGITRDPGEQARKIRDTIIPDQMKIMAWWLEKLK